MFEGYLVYTVEHRLSERQSSVTSNIRTHIFFVKIFSAFLFFKKNMEYSERVTKPAEIARQTAKSLLKEVEILLLKGIRNPAARKWRSTFKQRKISDYFTQ